MSKTINPNDYQKLEKENADLRAKVARLEAERTTEAKPAKAAKAEVAPKVEPSWDGDTDDR